MFTVGLLYCWCYCVCVVIMIQVCYHSCVVSGCYIASVVILLLCDAGF